MLCQTVPELSRVAVLGEEARQLVSLNPLFLVTLWCFPGDGVTGCQPVLGEKIAAGTVHLESRSRGSASEAFPQLPSKLANLR